MANETTGCRCYEHKRDRICPVHPRNDAGYYAVGKGLSFLREADGSVRVRIGEWGYEKHVRLSPAEWASIVAHVADGGSAEAFSAVEQLHKGTVLSVYGPSDSKEKDNG